MTTTTLEAESFRGPIPPPEMLAQYNDVAPGAAARILAMAEQQQTHRHMIETSAVRRNVEAQARGQWFGFILGAIAITGGIVLLGMGKDASGLWTLVTSVTGLVLVFMTGRITQAIERKKRRDELDAAVVKARDA